MEKMGGIGVLFILILLVSFSTLIHAANPIVEEGKCNVVLRSSCDNTPTNGYIAMGLTDLTDAHGETATSGIYDYVLCCRIGTGDLTCDTTHTIPDNKVLGLSDLTNAHGEIKSGTTYSTKVCYEDFSCEGKSACLEKEIGILSLSSSTNAHIGNFSAYPLKICCGGKTIIASFCKIKSVDWIDKKPVVEGEAARIEIIGSGAECMGVRASVDVYDKATNTPAEKLCDARTKSLCNISFNVDGIAYGSWVAGLGVEKVDGEKFYANITLNNRKETIPSKSSNELEIAAMEIEDECLNEDIGLCSDYTTEGMCKNDVCQRVGTSLEGIANCFDGSAICKCEWNSDDKTCGATYQAVTLETCGDFENGCNFGCTLCYNPILGTNYCNPGSACPDGEFPLTNADLRCDYGEGCVSEDCIDGDTDSCADGLFCSTGMCYSFEEPPLLPLGTGKCIITQTVTKECSDANKMKEITWTGVLEGGEQSGEKYEWCVAGGKNTIPCQTQIQLPFFEYKEMLLTLGLLIIIYVLVVVLRKKKKKKK